jgi:trigger factor
MNVKIEQVSSVKKKLSFEVPAEHVSTAIEKAYKKIGSTAKVKGFRPGKIPQAVLEQYYGPQMEQQVLNNLVNDTYFKALVEHKIPAVSGPSIVESSPLARGQVFTYQAEVEVKPDFEPKDYTGLKLQKEKLDADAKAIDERLREMAEGRAEMRPSTRKKAAKGDFVSIDFEGFVDGNPFDGGKAEGHTLELGSGSFIPGFEDQLIGMKTGSDGEVNVTFPENYGSKELAGKAALFKVRLHEIKEKVAPEIDDEFAKGFGLESLAELRTKLEEGYISQEQGRIDGDLRERLMTALIEKNPVEVPETMVVDQLDFMVGNIRRRLQHQGLSLEMMGMNDEAFKGMYRETAVKQVQGSLILEAIARKENIRVEESELDGKLAEIAAMANAPLESVKKYYAEAEAKRGLISQVAEEKVIKFLLDAATVKEVAKEKLTEPKADKKSKAEKE